MPCSEVVYTNYRWGRFSTDNSPQIIGGHRTDNGPITTDNAQGGNDRQTSNHKGCRHYRWESMPPIMTDNSKLSVAAGVYKTPRR